VSALFGLLTLFAGGSVILNLFGMREKEGNYILFVVWSNFICGFFYLFASYGFFKLKKGTTPLMKISIWILVAAFIVLIAWIINDKPFENKTIVALTFRILLTTGFFLISGKYISKKNQSV
jgi:uncharacterized membrane protein HdeD (DUF308 family)